MIVKDNHLPHSQWKLGIVREIMKGQNGLTRAATAKVASRDRQHSMLRRPIQLLYLLEIHSASTETSPSVSLLRPEPTEDLPERVEVNKRARPKRAAAKRADEARREWIVGLEGNN